MKNFLIRAVTGILFVIVLAGCILWNPLSCAILAALAAALVVFELCTLLNQDGKVQVNRYLSALAGACLVFSVFTFRIDPAVSTRLFLPYPALLLYLFIAELYRKQPNPIGNWAATLMSQLYAALPFALLALLAVSRESETGAIFYNPVLPLSVFIFLWLSDTGAYMVGSLIGKHRLFERISPKKSWEGSIGGALLAVASALALAHYFPLMSIGQWIGLALTVVVFGTWGDLCESLLKRQLGVKDSGNSLPGHGGWLDRFDSALLAIPAAVVYLYLL